VPNQGEFIAQMKTWARQTRNSVEEAVWHAVGASASAAADQQAAQPGDIGMRMVQLKAEAERYRSAAMTHLAKTGSRRGLNAFAGLAGKDEPDYVALWISVQADRDPFSAAEGASIAAMFDISVVVPQRGGTFFLDVSLPAKLQVGSRVASG